MRHQQLELWWPTSPGRHRIDGCYGAVDLDTTECGDDDRISRLDDTGVFIALFIVVDSIQEVGLISLLGTQIANLVGTNLILTMLTIIWSSALFSAVIANIPLTAAMLPMIGYLSVTVPGAQSHVLFYCLAVGSALGGNGTLIGASANMVTAGIADRAGYPITYIYFLKKGVPALIITLILATLWLLLRFVVLQ